MDSQAPLSLSLEDVRFERGRTLPFAQLPARTIALDGYVQGPAIDVATQRYSFDHHAGCVRHATLSTCEMVLDALRVGLDPAGLELRINDLDPDSLLSVWLLLSPNHSRSERVATAVRAAGRLDALGPADPGPGLWPCLRWALEPLESAERDGRSRFLDDSGVRALLQSCLERLERWAAAGAPATDERMQPPSRDSEEPPPIVQEARSEFVLARSDAGIGAFRSLYRLGHSAAIVQRPLADGTWEYTIGKASEFVAGFDIPRILAALAAAERQAFPEQSDDHTWGGGSTIGGSPRNLDGSGSRLDADTVLATVERCLG